MWLVKPTIFKILHTKSLAWHLFICATIILLHSSKEPVQCTKKFKSFRFHFDIQIIKLKFLQIFNTMVVKYYHLTKFFLHAYILIYIYENICMAKNRTLDLSLKSIYKNNQKKLLFAVLTRPFYIRINIKILNFQPSISSRSDVP